MTVVGLASRVAVVRQAVRLAAAVVPWVVVVAARAAASCLAVVPSIAAPSSVDSSNLFVVAAVPWAVVAVPWAVAGLKFDAPFWILELASLVPVRTLAEEPTELQHPSSNWK